MPSSAWRTDGTSLVVAAVLVSTVLLGAAVRLSAAQDQLWLDEIWTLELVAPLTSPWQVLIDLPHDNNHPLNSLWVYAVGRDADPVLIRSLSMALGTGSILAAGAIFRHPWSRWVAMALVAFSPSLVNHGSEARGYAALVFFVLVAVAALRRELVQPSARNRHVLGAALGLGLLSHLFALEALAVLAGWMVLRSWADRPLRAALRLTALTFGPAAVWLAAVGLCMAVAAARGVAFGGMYPFEPEAFGRAWADAARTMFGIPDAVPGPLLALLGAGFVAGVLWSRSSPMLLPFLLGGLGLPCILYVYEVPNTLFARYFLVSMLFGLLMLADVAGPLMARQGIAGWMARAGVLAILLLQGAGVRDLLQAGRGQYREAVRLMAQSGPFTYGSPREARTQRIVSYTASRDGIDATLVPRDAWCTRPPQWMVRDEPSAPEVMTTCEGTRPSRYVPVARFGSWRYGGVPWIVYRRAGESAALAVDRTSEETEAPISAAPAR